MNQIIDVYFYLDGECKYYIFDIIFWYITTEIFFVVLFWADTILDDAYQAHSCPIGEKFKQQLSSRSFSSQTVPVLVLKRGKSWVFAQCLTHSWRGMLIESKQFLAPGPERLASRKVSTLNWPCITSKHHASLSHFSFVGSWIDIHHIKLYIIIWKNHINYRYEWNYVLYFISINLIEKTLENKYILLDDKIHFAIKLRVFQQIRWILSKMLAIGNTVNSCTFFKNTKSDESKDCLQRLSEWPYWLLHPKFFLIWVIEFPLHGLSFPFRLIVANTSLDFCQHFFD